MAESTTHSEEAAPAGIAGVAQTFGLQPALFAGQLVNFLIVLGVLWIFAYKPILKMLAEREARIEKSVKDAQEIEKRVLANEKERAALLASAQKEAQELHAKTVLEAEARKVEMVEAAKREVERVIQKGKEQLKDEHTAMMIEARKDLVEIAVKAAAKIISTDMDEKKSKSLAEEVVRKLT
ncbi:MAG: ATP synthase F0 subunit B [Patescibacteria group bacterium]|jgi:F-type H+-transporting ATPase subunit b